MQQPSETRTATATISNAPTHLDYQQGGDNQRICAYCLGATTSGVTRLCTCPQDPLARLTLNANVIDFSDVQISLMAAVEAAHNAECGSDVGEDLSIAAAVIADVCSAFRTSHDDCNQHSVPVFVPESAWQESADGPAHLLAQLSVNGLPMHLEAWEVADFPVDGGASTEQRAVDRDEDLAMIFNAVAADAAFRTLTVRGRTYVLVATPHCD